MTTTLSKPIDSAEIYPHAVLSRGYSNAELTLIKAVWADTKQVAQQKMQLCIHLYELKKEMDANDPNAGNSPTQSRFWQAFELRDLPEYVTSSKPRVHEWLQAAEFATSKELSGAPDKSLLTLTPSTVCNISRIQHPVAKEILEQHLDQHDFIGHDAAGWLAKQDHNPTVIKQVKSWCKDNPTKALVPSVIKGIEAKEAAKQAELERKARVKADRERLEATIPAGSATVDVSTIGRTPEELEGRRRAKVVQDIFDAKDAEEDAKLELDYTNLAKAFTAADAAIRTYRSTLQNIITLNGSDYVDRLREYRSPMTGFNAIENDIQTVQTDWLTQLQAICKLLTERQSASEINFDDPNLVDVEAN